MLKVSTATVLFCIIFIVISQQVTAQVSDSLSRKDSVETIIDTATVIGVGDIMLGTFYPSRKYLPPKNDCSLLLKPLSAILKNADVTFGNLEGVFTDTDEDVKTCRDTNFCYVFGMPSKYVYCLSDAGFDVVSLANNHLGDFGPKGRESTIEKLNEAKINYAGLKKYPSATFIKNGIKFGFCAFAPNDETCDINDYDELQKIVSGLDKTCDVVIVSFHGGAEGADYQHVPREHEIYLEEDRGNVYEFARKAIDVGADIVFGNGPHVTRAIDLYKNRFIAYSLGNFCTWSKINLKGPNGIAPILKVYTDKKGKFLKAMIYSVYQIKYTPPKLDPAKRALNKIIELTRQDLPELNISISDNGLVLP